MNFYYYNAYITLNGEKTNIHLSDLLIEIALLNPLEKFKSTRYGEYALLRMKLPENNYKDAKDVLSVFVDYRNRKPKIGAKGSDRIDDIKDDVLEYTTFFYQYNNRLLVMQYNHFGAKAKHFEDYLMKFLPQEDDNEIWGVEIIEIPAPLGINDVLETQEFKYIDIVLDASTHETKEINSLSQSEPKSIIENLKLSNAKIGGSVARIYFGKGRKNENPIDTDEAKKFLKSLDLDSDMYVSIKVKYFSNHLHSFHELNLKNSAVLKRFIAVDGDSWEIIADTVEIDFYDKGRLGEKKAVQDLKSARLPDIKVKVAEFEERR